MSAHVYDDDGTPMRRTPDGELVPDIQPTPTPDPCPECGLRRGRHIIDCSLKDAP